METDRDFEIKKRGKAGEEYVCEYLRKRGCTIAERNYHSRWGEVDIIAENEARIIFVEVKTRTKSSFTTGFESITPSKLRKFTRTAEYYLMTHNVSKQPRIDCAQVIVDKATNELVKIDYIKNAV